MTVNSIMFTVSKGREGEVGEGGLVNHIYFYTTIFTHVLEVHTVGPETENRFISGRPSERKLR